MRFFPNSLKCIINFKIISNILRIKLKIINTLIRTNISLRKKRHGHIKVRYWKNQNKTDYTFQ